jgi:hypothetical protein
MIAELMKGDAATPAYAFVVPQRSIVLVER